MSYRARQRWPAIPECRRALVESHSAAGETCTIIVERQPHGPLLVSLHGAWQTTVAPCPEELAGLVEALRTEAGGW